MHEISKADLHILTCDLLSVVKYIKSVDRCPTQNVD